MMIKYTLSLVLLVGLVGCADDEATEPTETFKGQLSQQASEDLDEAIACDAVTDCPDGLACVSLDAEGVDGPICIEPGTECALLECGPGDCIQLEIYPPIVTCTDDDGVCAMEGSDCEVPDDDDTVCSDDGTCTNPGGSDDGVCSEDGGCSEPPGGSNDDVVCDEDGCYVPGNPGQDDPCPAGGCTEPGGEGEA